MRDTRAEAKLVPREAVRRLDPRARLRQALEMSDALWRRMDLGEAARLNASRVLTRDGQYVSHEAALDSISSTWDAGSRRWT